MSDNNNREFKVLSDRDHVLQRSGMYIGGTKLVDQEQWIVNRETGKFEYKQVKVVGGFLKIINEIIDNSIDVAIDTKFAAANKIQVKVDNKSVTVIDNGIGIPVKVLDTDENKRTLPEIAWTTLRAGTSFGDNREKIGANGLGSVATNIFSKVFIATSDDGKKQQTIKCYDNMAEIKPGKLKPSSGKSGVEVYFEPDLERFGLTEIDQIHQDLIYQRLVNLAISFPKIKFSFNGKQINISEKKFANMFSDNALLESSENTTICVFPNEYDEFKFYAQVNGLNTFRGGSHVEFITNEITTRVRDKLIKKYKSIRPGDVKTRLCIAIILTGFKDPDFDSQTKESLKNSAADVNRHLNGKIDFDDFVKKILKCDAIIDPIIETFKIKEELKARQELKAVKRIKVKSDKYMSPKSGTENKYLFLCEGQCLENNTEVFSIAENKSIKIKDLNIGDLVLSHTQKIQQVIGKSSSLKQCFKIRTKTGKEVICSSEHRWFVFDTISKTFKFKKTKNLNLKTDKLVSNKLKYGFVLSKITIEDWTGLESEKYKFKMFGENFEVATSAEHKFIVFDEIKQEFIVKQVKDIDVINDKMVLLVSN